MKTYSVFTHPINKPDLVKHGWSWPAFFFGWIWTLFKKMWLNAFLIFCANAAINIGGRIIEHQTGTVIIPFVVSLALMSACGYYGNVWRARDLTSRGFSLSGEVTAINVDAGLAEFSKGYSVEPDDEDRVSSSPMSAASS